MFFGLQQASISPTLFYCHDRTGTRWFKNESSEPSYSSGNSFGGKPNWASQFQPYDGNPGTLQTADFNPSLKANKTSTAPDPHK